LALSQHSIFKGLDSLSEQTNMYASFIILTDYSL
jgi:hypothetical protein